MQTSSSQKISVSVLNEQSGQHLLWRPKHLISRPRRMLYFTQLCGLMSMTQAKDLHEYTVINCLKKQTRKWGFVKVLYGAVSSIQTNGNGDRMEAKRRHACHSPTGGYGDSILWKSLENRVGSSLVCLHQGTIGVAVISIRPHSLVIG